jgi:uncharacterized protein (DUF58 family)
MRQTRQTLRRQILRRLRRQAKTQPPGFSARTMWPFFKPVQAKAQAPATAPAGVTAEHLLRRLEWTVLRRLDGLLQGDYRTLLRGTGMDLADLREYQHHDDVRHIDWNVTARQAVPHVRVFTEDREMAAWFLLDLSPSVDFGSGASAKRELATEFVAVLARLLTRHGNRVGALLYGHGVDRVLPARSSRLHVLQLLHAMQNRPPATTGATRLQDLLQAGATTVRRRSTVFVVSDFISEPGWQKPLGQLAQRHEVVAVRLFDPMELDLPDLGLLPMRDAETGEQVLIDTGDAAFRRRFSQVAAQRETELRQALAGAGVDTLELSTADNLVEALLRFTELRRRRSQRLPAHMKALPA